MAGDKRSGKKDEKKEDKKQPEKKTTSKTEVKSTAKPSSRQPRGPSRWGDSRDDRAIASSSSSSSTSRPAVVTVGHPKPKVPVPRVSSLDREALKVVEDKPMIQSSRKLQTTRWCHVKDPHKPHVCRGGHPIDSSRGCSEHLPWAWHMGQCKGHRTVRPEQADQEIREYTRIYQHIRRQGIDPYQFSPRAQLEPRPEPAENDLRRKIPSADAIQKSQTSGDTVSRSEFQELKSMLATLLANTAPPSLPLAVPVVVQPDQEMEGQEEVLDMGLEERLEDLFGPDD